MGHILEIQDQGPFCKKRINSGIQLGAIRDKIEEIRSLKVNQR
jgi:hypothetical protein